MFEKDKKIFHFFGIKKKEDPLAVKAGKVTIKTFSAVFKFFSYLFGTLFFMSIGLGILNMSSREERMQRYEEMNRQMQHQRLVNHQEIGKFSLELVDAIKSQKNSTLESTVANLKEKFGKKINYKFADNSTLILSRAIDYSSFEYIISLDNHKVSLLDSNSTIFKEFEKIAKDRKDISWNQTSTLDNLNNVNNKGNATENIKEKYLNISY